MHFQQCASKREPFKAARHPVADGISDLERRGIEIELEGTILSFHALHHASPLLRYYRKAAPGFTRFSLLSFRILCERIVLLYSTNSKEKSSEFKSLCRTSFAFSCLKKKKKSKNI